MNKILSLAVFTIFISSPAMAASNQSLGVGIVLGSPTGFTGQYLMGRDHAIDAALAWNFGDGSVMHIHGDYLWRKVLDMRNTPEPLVFYFGVGARLLSWSDHDYRHHHDHESGVALGARFPAGLSYTFRDPGIEIFGEVAVVMDIVPGTDLDLDAGIGGRFYF